MAVAAPVVVGAPVAVAPPQPVLSRINQHVDRSGVCGNFKFTEDWHVANPGAGGVIVQHIVRHFNVHRYDGLVAVSLADYENAEFPLHFNELDYWEMWVVNGAGVVTHGMDEFAMSSVTPGGRTDRSKNTTMGSYTITGTAIYYPTTTTNAVTLGFTGAVAAAGILANNAADPTATVVAHQTLGTQASVPVTRTVTVAWDSGHMTRPPNKRKGGTYGKNRITIT